jgi:hypothetical protein
LLPLNTLRLLFGLPTEVGGGGTDQIQLLQSVPGTCWLGTF